MPGIFCRFILDAQPFHDMAALMQPEHEILVMSVTVDAMPPIIRRGPSAPVRILAPAATASARNVAVPSCFAPEAQPKPQQPQLWPASELRGISPQCTPRPSRPSFSF